MRCIRAVGAFAGLLLSIGTLYASDPPAADDAPPTPWYDRVFSSPKPVEKKAPVEKPPTREEVARSFEQEMKAYNDRSAFCIKLRQIAEATNDDTLRQKAEKLEKLAFEIYLNKKTSLDKRMEQAKAAQAALEEKRTWGPATGTTSTASTTTARAPNGKPLVNRE
jgi:hypothetical protein